MTGRSIAQAQESLLPLPLERMSISDALAKSKREHRILIVVREWKRPPQGRRPWWVNDSVRAWISWHAVLVEAQPNDPEGKLYFNGVRRDDSSKYWGMDVFVDGEKTRLLKCDIPALGIDNGRDPCDPTAANGPDDHEPSTLFVAPTAAAVLGQLDLKLMSGAERDPLWGELHKRDCPEPARPGRMYWYGVEKDGLPRTDDVKTPVRGDCYVDVFARIKAADASSAAGRHGEAAALLVWAWERGPEVDLAFALARAAVVLPRLEATARAEPVVLKRMEQIADAELALYPWFDDHEEVGYLLMRWTNGDKARVQERVAVESIDLDEEAMGGVVSQRLGWLKAQVTEMPLRQAVAPEQWRKLLRSATRALPRMTDLQPRQRWERARIELLAIAAARQYALLLDSSEPAERARAERVAEDVLKAIETSDPTLRAKVLRALAFAAVAAGRSGSIHAGWLVEASKLDPTLGKDAAVDPLLRHIGGGKNTERSVQTGGAVGAGVGAGGREGR